jgi:hypothetical protein
MLESSSRWFQVAVGRWQTIEGSARRERGLDLIMWWSGERHTLDEPCFQGRCSLIADKERDTCQADGRGGQVVRVKKLLTVLYSSNYFFPGKEGERMTGSPLGRGCVKAASNIQ